jgi:hypothetical protein
MEEGPSQGLEARHRVATLRDGATHRMAATVMTQTSYGASPEFARSMTGCRGTSDKPLADYAGIISSRRFRVNKDA